MSRSLLREADKPVDSPSTSRSTNLPMARGCVPEHRTCQNSGGVYYPPIAHNPVKDQNERDGAGRDTAHTPQKSDRCARPVDIPMCPGLYCQRVSSNEKC